jgi:hypothetical protein
MAREPKREILPIPDIPAPGLTTYDAKDPDTSYPGARPRRPQPSDQARGSSRPRDGDSVAVETAELEPGTVNQQEARSGAQGHDQERF